MKRYVTIELEEFQYKVTFFKGIEDIKIKFYDLLTYMEKDISYFLCIGDE